MKIDLTFYEAFYDPVVRLYVTEGRSFGRQSPFSFDYNTCFLLLTMMQFLVWQQMPAVCLYQDYYSGTQLANYVGIFPCSFITTEDKQQFADIGRIVGEHPEYYGFQMACYPDAVVFISEELQYRGEFYTH